MLNPGAAGALDPAAARGFAQAYGQQQANAAGFPLGNLAGALQGGLQTGLQGGLQNVRGGLAGLQANAANQQQAAAGRFTAQQAQALQNNLQQLNQFQARQGALGNANLANGVLGGNAVAAGVRAGGLGGLAINNPQLNAIRPGVDRGNIAGLGLGPGVGQQNLGIQGYPPASLAAALAAGNQQANLQNLQNINRLAAGVQLQNNINLQQAQRLQNIGMLQQGLPAGNAQGQDLLGLLARNKNVNQALGGGGGGGPDAYAAQLKLQQQQQPGQRGVGGEFSIANSEDFPALSSHQAPRNGDDARGAGGFAGLQAQALGRGGFMVGGPAPGEFGGAAQQLADYDTLLRLQQAQAAQQQAQAAQAAAAAGGQQQQQQRMAAIAAQQPKPGLAGAPQGGAGGAAGADDKAGGAPASPAGPPPDRWGLLAIMPLLKMTDQDATMLELGINLTTLGLDLTSPSSLHKHLVTPLSSQPIRPEPEFELPSCYRHVPQRLAPGYLSKFKEETLFYIFYSMPADEAQLIAADELSARGWVFHKRLRMWMLPAPNMPAPAKTQRGERGTFLVFNPMAWEVESKADMELLYEDCEVAPRLPRNPPRAGGAGPAAGGAPGQPPAGPPPGQPQQPGPPGQPAAAQAGPGGLPMQQAAPARA